MRDIPRKERRVNRAVNESLRPVARLDSGRALRLNRARGSTAVSVSGYTLSIARSRASLFLPSRCTSRAIHACACVCAFTFLLRQGERRRVRSLYSAATRNCGPPLFFFNLSRRPRFRIQGARFELSFARTRASSEKICSPRIMYARRSNDRICERAISVMRGTLYRRANDERRKKNKGS